jgi:hypothetical protein
MRSVSFAGVLLVLLLLSQASWAQTPETRPATEPSPQTEPAPATRRPPPAEPEREALPRRAGRGGRNATGKRGECRAEARNKGLRGRPMQDAALICYQEARLDCLKKAVAEGVERRDRRTYIAECLGEEPRRRRSDR